VQQAPAPRRVLRASAPMLRYVAVRLVTLLVSLVLAAVVVFVVLRLLPGDSAGVFEGCRDDVMTAGQSARTMSAT
jgi:ABC-type dipeptide/oligopeptide/nickel transport system permease component